MTTLGDCYEVAGDEAMRRKFSGSTARFRVVHADVFSTAMRNWHGHAWVEERRDLGGIMVWFAVDNSNGNDVDIPAGAYRHLGKVRDVREYTVAEACGHMLRTEKYGPWEEASDD